MSEPYRKASAGSSMQCPACGGALSERSLAGHAVRACDDCRGLWIERGVVRALREVSPDAHPWLSEASDAIAPDGGAVADAVGKRRCPKCGALLLGYAFGGGNVDVEACDRCDSVFLDRGELGAIVREARQGIVMTEEAKQALHAARVASTWSRLASAEGGVAVIGLVAIYIFVRLVIGFGPSWIVVSGAAAIAAIVFWWRRSALLRDEQRAEQRLLRLADAEASRLEKRPDHPHGAAPAAPRNARPRRCAFCGAALQPASTRCAACDSDFG